MKGGKELDSWSMVCPKRVCLFISIQVKKKILFSLRCIFIVGDEYELWNR